MTLSFILPHSAFIYVTDWDFDFDYGFLSFIYFDTHFDDHFQSLSHQNQEQMNFLKFIVWICLKKKQNFSIFSMFVTFYSIKQ